MIQQKHIAICISPNRMFGIRYEFTGFNDGSFYINYYCPFSKGLIYKHINGIYSDLRKEDNPDKDSLEGGYIYLYLPHEIGELKLPVIRYEYTELVKWLTTSYA